MRKNLKNLDFTIISNNCWGGGVYEQLGLSYTTPTVGLFFFTPCYIKFISNLQANLAYELKFIDHSKYNKANQLRLENKYPIGLINNEIEIHFLHYKTQSEAFDKWTRRKERVNFKNLFFSFTDNESYTIEELKTFDELPYRKVFFSSKNIAGIDSLVWLKKFNDQGKIGDIYTYPDNYRKYFNVLKWLNKS
jgi:uncharacterized protein (DUF1919 family)